jgi:hypothetical protein
MFVDDADLRPIVLVPLSILFPHLGFGPAIESDGLNLGHVVVPAWPATILIVAQEWGAADDIDHLSLAESNIFLSLEAQSGRHPHPPTPRRRPVTRAYKLRQQYPVETLGAWTAQGLFLWPSRGLQNLSTSVAAR